jgi:hypothetical protein
MTITQKLDKLAEALNALRTARDALREIQQDRSDHGFICGDAGHYAKEIDDLISCDHGGSGLESLLRIVEQRLA